MRKDTQQQTYSHRNSPVFPFNDQRCSNNFVVAARLFFNILLIGSSRPHYDVMSAQFEVISTVIRLFFFFFVSLSAQHHIVNYSVSSINSIRSFVFSYFYYSSAQFKCYNNSMNFIIVAHSLMMILICKALVYYYYTCHGFLISQTGGFVIIIRDSSLVE